MQKGLGFRLSQKKVASGTLGLCRDCKGLLWVPMKVIQRMFHKLPLRSAETLKTGLALVGYVRFRGFVGTRTVRSSLSCYLGFRVSGLEFRL